MAKKSEEDPEIVRLSERVARLEENIKWIMKSLEKVDRRTWYILTSVLLSILVMIWNVIMT